MKLRLSVYLEPSLMAQLNALADQKGQSKSLVAEAAIASFLTPDEADRREAAFARRHDRLSRQVARLERDVMIAAESLGLFIRLWFSANPPLPDVEVPAAQAKGRERFEAFIETLGRRLANGRGLLAEVSLDLQRSASAIEPRAAMGGNAPSSEGQS